LTQLLALEQTGGRTGALLSKNIDQAVKSLHAFFSDCVRSLEWCAVQRQVPSINCRCTCDRFEIFRSDFRNYFMVFLGSSCRETAKNAIKKIDGKIQLFRPKAFDMDFPQNVFCGVFELPLLRNAH
jgi:hypothetical protein